MTGFAPSLGTLPASVGIDGIGTAFTHGPPLIHSAYVTGPVPTDTETYTDGTLLITDSFGRVTYQHNPKFRGRGNTTWGADKKPFKVRSQNRRQQPFRYAPSRDWAFMADYFDQSYVRSSIGFEIYRRATGRWAPFSTHIWLDWEGATTAGGLYRYSETVDVQVGRVDIRTMAAGDTSGNPLTGPYFVETDDYFLDPGFTTTAGTPVSWDVPETPVAEQIAYMTDWTNATEAILLTGTATEIAERFDLDSFVDWYLIQEFVANIDATWYKSIKWMKDQDSPNGTGKAVMQSPWDLDLTLGRNWGGGPSLPATGWMIQADAGVSGSSTGRPNWMYHLWNRWPAFQTACRERWDEAFNPVIKTLEPFIDREDTIIGDRVDADRDLWFAGTPQPSDHSIPFLKTWIEDRRTWIDSNL